MLERLSNRILVVGGHPFRFCMKHPNHQRRSSSNTEKPQEGQDEVCCCSFCQTHSPLYARCWPAIFLFSAITDFPMPLPQGKKPGQHRDWGWLPVLVVLCLVAFMYYTYLTPLCLTLFQNGHRAQAIVYLVPLHLWVLMFLCSYARVVLQKPGSPKKSSTISPEETVAKQDKTSESPYTSLLGGSKWCEACQCWKPDRTHHCRVCDACVLKMDHHCPWVNGCVGYANYRYFIQFLCYTSGMATWVFTTTLAAFIMGNGLTTYSGIVIALIILSGIVMIVIGTFTCSHLWLVTLNRTTIENIQFRAWNNNQSSKKPATFTYSGKNVFNQGTFKNWTEVMGDKWWQWFFPIAAKTRCNGVNFGYNSETLEEYQRARS